MMFALLSISSLLQLTALVLCVKKGIDTNQSKWAFALLFFTALMFINLAGVIIETIYLLNK